MNTKPAWNKGKKFPHSPEWEQKRLAAVKESIKNKPHRRGYTRPREHVQPMLDALARNRTNNPNKYREIARCNLPKDLRGCKNGNWRGGKTQVARDFRTQQSTRFTKFRKAILERDGHKCRDCGSTDNLQIHHLIPLSETHSTAFMLMNGVTLCHTCHVKTDTYGAKARNRADTLVGTGVRRSPMVEQLLGRTLCLAWTIPHKYQAYPTVGNYSWAEDGSLVIFISDMKNDDYEFLVFVHELVEATLCRRRGIRLEDIDAFDIAFEAARVEGNTDEPGHDPHAPYHHEHVFAEKVERLLAHELGVDWDTYETVVEAL